MTDISTDLRYIYLNHHCSVRITRLSSYDLCGLRLVTFVLFVCVSRGLFKDLRNLQKVLLSEFEVCWATQWVRYFAFLSKAYIYTH